MSFGEEKHRGKVPFSSRTMYMIYDCDGNLDHLVEVVFVRCLYSEATLLCPCHTLLLEKRSPCLV